MIHMHIGKEVQQNTKTACGVKLEDLPRKDASVPYQSRKATTCACCAGVAEKTATMRGDQA